MAALATTPKQPAPGPTCGNCRWRRTADNRERCFAVPPTPALPWGEKSFRPVVGVADLACSMHEEVAKP